MKFRRISIHNVNELVPDWAIDPYVLGRHLDEVFDSQPGCNLVPEGSAVYRSLGFWIEVDATASPATTRVCTPDDHVDLSGRLIITCRSRVHESAQIDLPLNPIFKGYEALAGTYCVYLHSFQTEVPLGYVGMTKQRWFDRYSQHLSASRTGSPFLFHRAIREHLSATVYHKVFYCELDHDRALGYEEELVSMFSLYPLGLNMVPGGRAAFAYLAKLGLQARSAEDRDSLVERLSDQADLDGHPNPLCAARWATDPSFAERVICGHSGRLTVEQVSQIRRFAAAGKSVAAIMVEVSARNERQIRNALSGRTYSRIARRSSQETPSK